SLEWAKARGAVVQRHSYESALDLATFEPARFSGVPQGLQARGIRLTTMADLPPEAGRQLYDLWAKTAHDNPSYRGGGDPPFEHWSKWVLQNPNMPLDCLIVAMDGDRIVGTTGLLRLDNGSYYTDYTGVDREYRGRGIALALKLFSIRKALAAGAPYMRTNNDSTNAPMLAVNRKLGYTPRPGVFIVDLTI
ncbi:MAG TPA: GNAT family N-acetyltransferase, partial [Symbiobacteriaceae bacterium]|nr:GNAT family N-acetyltransferase [Symbiobacteriaceae bacterium]